MPRLLPALAVLAIAMAGCSNEPYKTARVSGRITVNGKPLSNASVIFSPVSAGSANPGPGSAGTTDADGRYTLVLVSPGSEVKGAVVGKHKVSITLSAESDPSDDRPKKTKVKQLPPQYNQATKLEFIVPEKGTESADFDLTVP